MVKAPLAFWGTSAGSNVSACYCERFPTRVAAFASSKGTFDPGDNQSSVMQDIPMFFALGATDKAEWLSVAQPNIEKGMQARAPWTLALHKKEGHSLGLSLDALIPFLKAAIELRIAGSGTPVSSDSAAASGFKTARPTFSKPSAGATQSAASSKLYKISLASGWLGDRETYEVAAAKDFTGGRSTAIWLPDEASAKAWQQYLQSGN